MPAWGGGEEKVAEVGLGVGLGVEVELDDRYPSSCLWVAGGDGVATDAVVANKPGGSEARRMLGIGSVSGRRTMGLGSGRTRTPHAFGLCWGCLCARVEVTEYPVFGGLSV